MDCNDLEYGGSGALGGFVVWGASEYENAGTTVATAGDFNGDGYDDLLIGAPNNEGHANPNGRVYVLTVAPKWGPERT